MISFKHIGIYVKDIEKMSIFYEKVFKFIIIKKNQRERGIHIDALLGVKNAELITTKMISEYGKENGNGDMLELIKIDDASYHSTEKVIKSFYDTGVMHIALSVDNIEEVADFFVIFGGKILVKPLIIPENENKIFFGCDPEENFIEIIEYKDRILAGA